MKKIIFIAFFAFSMQITFAQNPNPFKSIGKPAPEILSLTNGKYPEIFENDTLRKIGSVMFNTRTNKIEYFIETDTMYSEATLQPEIVSRWLSIDPLARKYPNMSPYNFVNNNPIIYKDPDGRDAILVVFPDYKVDPELKVTIWGKTFKSPKLPLGHAGVLLIDNKTGVTKYYEYGRYQTSDGVPGKVRKVTISNVIIGKDGKPTAESLNKVLGEISKNSGHNGRIKGAYINSDAFDKQNAFAKGKQSENSDPNRKPYDVQNNNCGTFSCDVIGQDETVDQPTIINPTPNNIVDEYIEEGNAEVNYNPKTKKTTIGTGNEKDAKKTP